NLGLRAGRLRHLLAPDRLVDAGLGERGEAEPARDRDELAPGPAGAAHGLQLLAAVEEAVADQSHGSPSTRTALAPPIDSAVESRCASRAGRGPPTTRSSANPGSGASTWSVGGMACRSSASRQAAASSALAPPCAWPSAAFVLDTGTAPAPKTV